MGYASQPKCRSMVAVLLLYVTVWSLPIPSVSAITTTDSLVEATHTTLPVTLLGETDPPPDDLSEAETKDPTQQQQQRLEIIKQIRKVNQDGSYTVGYEAEDGTFKIESRDVLGNIKGTYGYIDANGDIKRVSYGGGQPTQTLPLVTTPATPDEEIVHIPPRFNRTQHLLMPTTRRPPNYHPPQQHQHHLHHNPQHASTLRPSVIQTIPRKRNGFTSTTTTPAQTASSSTMSMNGGIASSTTPTTTPTTTNTTATPTSTATVESTSAGTETGGHLAAAFGEPTAASTHHTSTLHSKPQGTLLIIRPTPLPYQSSKTAEQLARPERLEASRYTHAPPSKKPVRGNFLRRQLPPPAVSESGEQYEAQPQQIIYGQSVSDGGELASIYGGGGAKPLYTTHPTPRIPAAVLAARQRAAHIQSVLHAQSQPAGGSDPTRTTERVYVKQPARPHQTPAPIQYESSTEPSTEHSYVTDGPATSSVVQIPAANRALAASEAEPHPEERRPIFRPRPIEFRPREDGSTPAPTGRYRTPYGLPPPYGGRSFPPPTEYGGGRDLDEKEREGGDEPHHLNSLLAYRQQRRLNLPQAADPAYQVQQSPSAAQQQQQQQQQNSYPIPAPYNPPGYPRLAPSNPYYYDIPPERPLTARDFERILQVLIFRHQQQQQQQHTRYRLGGVGGGYGAGYNGAFPYNPYFPGPSPAPFGFGNPYLGGGYPQQQIPRPPLPFPYPGGPYDGQGYQNPLYSPSAPSASVRGDAGQPDPSDGGYGAVLPARRNGQYYQPGLEGPGSTASGSLRSADYLPPEVRESLLYRMLMLAIQAPGAGTEVLPLAAPTGPSGGQYPLQHLQGASSMPRPQTQPNQRTVQGRTDGPSMVVTRAAATMPPMAYSKKPVRSVQILGEE